MLVLFAILQAVPSCFMFSSALRRSVFERQKREVRKNLKAHRESLFLLIALFRMIIKFEFPTCMFGII